MRVFVFNCLSSLFALTLFIQNIACDKQKKDKKTTTTSPTPVEKKYKNLYKFSLNKKVDSKIFTVHGLWPITATCQGKAISCSTLSKQDMLKEMSFPLKQELKKIMKTIPNIGRTDEDFWNYEYQKHGSYTRITIEEYF